MATNAHPSPEAPIPADSINGSSAPDGLDQSKSLPKDITDFIAARVELASIEAKEASEYATSKVTAGISLAICGFFTWALLLAGFTGIFAPMVDQAIGDQMGSIPGWATVLLGFAILHGIGAYVFLGQLKKKPKSPLFELSRKEIEHDKQWLTKNK